MRRARINMQKLILAPFFIFYLCWLHLRRSIFGLYVNVYSGVGGFSIYILPNQGGKGIGNLLLKSEVAGYWTLQAAIFHENNTGKMVLNNRHS